MKPERKILPIARKVSFVEAEKADDEFWANASIEERLAETERLRRMVWTFRLGNYPEKMEITGRTVLLKYQDDGDDF